MNQNAVHSEFHNYDWESFEEFQQGLSEILDNHLEALRDQDASVTSIPAAERQQLVDQAKSFFFCTKTGHILNLDEYYAWKRSNHSKIQEITHEEDEGSTSVSANSEEAPYSTNYQQLVELIVSGKPVPGIKTIPDTVLAEQKSQSTAAARPKPWAKKSEQSQTEVPVDTKAEEEQAQAEEPVDTKPEDDLVSEETKAN